MMKRSATLVMMLILVGCASESMDTPQAIATSWCERNHPGEELCLRTAMEAHAQCITGAGDYGECRARRFRDTQTANN